MQDLSVEAAVDKLPTSEHGDNKDTSMQFRAGSSEIQNGQTHMCMMDQIHKHIVATYYITTFGLKSQLDLNVPQAYVGPCAAEVMRLFKKVLVPCLREGV